MREEEKVPSPDIRTGCVFDFSPSMSFLPCREQWDVVAQIAEQVAFFASVTRAALFSSLLECHNGFG